MIRRPPRSTLFPTRRSSDLDIIMNDHIPNLGHFAVNALVKYRSEEHTSELQSHSDLVCRLLLEKKKKKQRTGFKERKLYVCSSQKHALPKKEIARGDNTSDS